MGRDWWMGLADGEEDSRASRRPHPHSRPSRPFTDACALARSGAGPQRVEGVALGLVSGFDAGAVEGEDGRPGLAFLASGRPPPGVGRVAMDQNRVESKSSTDELSMDEAEGDLAVLI